MLGACLAMAKSHDEDAGRGLGYGGVGVGGGELLPGKREEKDAAESLSGATNHIYKRL